MGAESDMLHRYSTAREHETARPSPPRQLSLAPVTLPAAGTVGDWGVAPSAELGISPRPMLHRQSSASLLPGAGADLALMEAALLQAAAVSAAADTPASEAPAAATPSTGASAVPARSARDRWVGAAAAVLRRGSLRSAQPPPAAAAPAAGPWRMRAASAATAVLAAQNATLAPDPAVRLRTLPNGLRVVLCPNRAPSAQVCARLAVGVGSVHEAPAEQGVAHLVEHLCFMGRYCRRAGGGVERHSAISNQHASLLPSTC